MVNGWLIFGGLLAAHIAVMVILQMTGWRQRLNLEYLGPLVMVRSQFGQGLINWLGRFRTTFRWYGSASMVLVYIMMAFLTLSVYASAALASTIPADQAPAASEIIGIPKINPLIPLWYGIAGLVVAIVVHEAAHGVLARAQNLKIKSLGLLFLILPIGAFVEPDEQEMQAAPRLNRMRVYAVGPSTNLVIAILAAVLVSGVLLNAVIPVEAGPVVWQAVPDTPLEPGMLVVEVNGTRINSLQDIDSLDLLVPTPTSALVPITVREGDEERTIEVRTGLFIHTVLRDSPAQAAGIIPGMILTGFAGQAIANGDDFQAAFHLDAGQTQRLPAGTRVNVTVLAKDDNGTWQERTFTNITLAERSSFVGGEASGEGFLGVVAAPFGAILRTAEDILQPLADPFEDAEGFGYVVAAVVYTGLPFTGGSPVSPTIASYFEVQGVFGLLGDQVFWIAVNSLYWIFWLNLVVGTTNALPMFPLDGYHFFRDTLDASLKRIVRVAKSRERWVTGISRFATISILLAIIWIMVGPRVA